MNRARRPSVDAVQQPAEQAYREAGAGDRLKIVVARGVGHSVTAGQRQAALAWLERWLKP